MESALRDSETRFNWDQTSFGGRHRSKTLLREIWEYRGPQSGWGELWARGTELKSRKQSIKNAHLIRMLGDLGLGKKEESGIGVIEKRWITREFGDFMVPK